MDQSQLNSILLYVAPEQTRSRGSHQSPVIVFANDTVLPLAKSGRKNE